jgi:glutamate carboxypeptidase
MPIGAEEMRLLDWLDAQHGPMIELLAKLVNTDSGSFDLEGVDRAGYILRDHLEARGVPCTIIPRPGVSFCLRAGVGAETPERGHVLLLGHRDTVFPKGTAADRPFTMDGTKGFGPGVADMKAGLVMCAFVLEAFARTGLARRPLVALFTSDEEIASPASRPVIEEMAKGACAVFNAEPARPDGNIVRARKGALFLTIEVTGRPAHSGSAHEKGISAIEELCRKVTELHALTDCESGTTMNVGLIEGGQSVNTVAPWAKARLDVRFWTLTAMAEAEAAIARVLARTHLPGTTTRITERGQFLPLEPSPANTALFEHYVGCAAKLGITLGGEATGGSADSGFTAAAGAPMVCGIGPVGEKAHSPEERCHLDTLVPRAKALALAIATLDQM